MAAGLQVLFAVVYFLAVYGAGILAVLLTGNLFAGILGFAALMAYGPVLYLTYTELNDRFFDTILMPLRTDVPGTFFSPVTAYIQASNYYGSDSPVTVYLIYGILLAAVLLLAVGQGLPETSRDLPAHQADVLQEDLTPSPKARRQSKCKGKKCFISLDNCFHLRRT